MKDHLKSEKRILNISFAGSAVFLLAECVMAVITRSHAILTDCVYDIADVIMLGPILILVPLLYKPVTEKRPYGFSQVESLLIMIRCGLLIFITGQLIIESIQMIAAGGHTVDAGAIATFELIMSVLCVMMYLLIRYLNKKCSSPTIQSEIYVWKLDAISTLGVGAAFVIHLFLQETSLAWLAPYVDPAIAMLMGIILLKDPICMFCDVIRSLILFAPKKEVVEHVRDIAEMSLKKYHFDINCLDVIKTGRKLWIEVYILQKEDLISISALREAHSEIMKNL